MIVVVAVATVVAVSHHAYWVRLGRRFSGSWAEDVCRAAARGWACVVAVLACTWVALFALR